MTHQDMTNDEGVIDIPVRIQEQRTQTAEQIRRLEDQQRETEDMIHQYERKYGYVRYEDAGEAPHQAAREVGMTDKKKKNDGWFSDLRENMPPRHRYPTPAVKANVLSENEENWAFIAHASALLTLVMALSTGPGVLLALLIPLGIYFFHRNKSQFVAFHALQAFTLQVSCTIGVMLLAVVGGLLTALLAITIIGIPLAIIFAIVFFPLLAFLPFGMVIYGMIAAFATRGGRNYRYPYVADWVDDQLNNGIFGINL